MSGVRIDAVGVVVSDMAASVAFYRGLGCDFAEGAEAEGHAEARLGDVRLMLDSEQVLASWASWGARAGTRVVLAARCRTAAEVDALHDDLASRGSGSVRAPFDAPWGMRYAVVADPDGSHVELYADL